MLLISILFSALFVRKDRVYTGFLSHYVGHMHLNNGVQLTRSTWDNPGIDRCNSLSSLCLHVQISVLYRVAGQCFFSREPQTK